jgi:hypothetical protein
VYTIAIELSSSKDGPNSIYQKLYKEYQEMKRKEKQETKRRIAELSNSDRGDVRRLSEEYLDINQSLTLSNSPDNHEIHNHPSSRPIYYGTYTIRRMEKGSLWSQFHTDNYFYFIAIFIGAIGVCIATGALLAMHLYLGKTRYTFGIYLDKLTFY